MSESIVVAIIAGIVTLAGTVITVISTSSKTQQEIKTNQAVTDQKIDTLTEEVREHNNFARRMPVLEERVNDISRRIEQLERR